MDGVNMKISFSKLTLEFQENADVVGGLEVLVRVYLEFKMVDYVRFNGFISL